MISIELPGEMPLKNRISGGCSKKSICLEINNIDKFLLRYYNFFDFLIICKDREMKKITLRILFLAVFILLLTQCSVKDWEKFANSPFKTKPNWDIGLELDIVERIESIGEYLPEFDTSINAEAAAPFVWYQWPFPHDLESTGEDETDPVQIAKNALIKTLNDDPNFDFEGRTLTVPSVTYDMPPISFGGNGDDEPAFENNYLSADGGNLSITVGLLWGDYNEDLEIGDIGIESFYIGDTLIEFGEAELINDGGVDKLKFDAPDFLKEGDGIGFKTEKDENGNIKRSIEISNFKITLNPGKKDARYEDVKDIEINGNQIVVPRTNEDADKRDFKLVFFLEFNIGDDWKITGDVVKEVSLFEEGFIIEVPSENMPINDKALTIYLGFKNSTSLPLFLDISFEHSEGGDIELLHNGKPGLDLSGVNGKEWTNFKLTTSDTVFDKKDLKVKLDPKMLKSDGVKISKDLEFGLRLGIDGKANLNLDKLF